MSKGGYRLLAGIASINRSSLGAAASTLPIKPIPPASFVYFVMFCDVVTSCDCLRHSVHCCNINQCDIIIEFFRDLPVYAVAHHSF